MLIHRDLVFPSCITYGSVLSPKYSTTKLVVGGGKEYRFSQSEYPLHAYDVKIERMDPADHKDIVSLFHVVSGELDSFMFMDPSDHTSNNVGSVINGEDVSPTDQLVGLVTGTSDEYPIYKRYVVEGKEKRRRIYFPLADTLRVAIDGHEVTNFEYADASFTLNFLQSIATKTVAVTVSGSTLTSGSGDLPEYSVNDLIHITGFGDDSYDKELGENPYRVVSSTPNTMVIENYDSTPLALPAGSETLILEQAPPPAGAAITCGFYFYTLVRFDDESLDIEPVAGLRDTIISNLNSIRLIEVSPL